MFLLEKEKNMQKCIKQWMTLLKYMVIIKLYIYSSNFIQNLKNVEAGYWGEGVAFHKSKLLNELISKGIQF